MDESTQTYFKRLISTCKKFLEKVVSCFFIFFIIIIIGSFVIDIVVVGDQPTQIRIAYLFLSLIMFAITLLYSQEKYMHIFFFFLTLLLIGLSPCMLIPANANLGLNERLITWVITSIVLSYPLYKVVTLFHRGSKRLISDEGKSKPFTERHHRKQEQLTSNTVEALSQERIKARSFERNDYKILPEFNWDVKSFDYEAAVYLIDEFINILHVVAIHEQDLVHFRVKGLVRCPTAILDARARRDEAFSVSYKAEEGERWRSDISTELGELISQYLNKDRQLLSILKRTGHTNVNAWLEESDFLSINSSKRYSKLEEMADFIPICNRIIRNLKKYHQSSTLLE
jgi:hypothetical protein